MPTPSSKLVVHGYDQRGILAFTSEARLWRQTDAVVQDTKHRTSDSELLATAYVPKITAGTSSPTFLS
jgi:hypothetical protein